MLERRVSGFPLEQVVGWADFCGQRIHISPSVFVPRRRTEFLARLASALAFPGAVVVDMCCGSGAVGTAVARSIGPLVLHAADVDPAAVLCARANLEPLGGTVHQGDLFDPLPSTLRLQVDLVVANAPYVPSGSVGLMPPEARLHEPLVALDGGADGLDIQRRLAAEAPRWLVPHGKLLLETSDRQAEATAEILEGCGFAAVIESCVELDATVVVGTR
jgi:release factor glutamine methyltransferase